MRRRIALAAVLPLIAMGACGSDDKKSDLDIGDDKASTKPAKELPLTEAEAAKLNTVVLGSSVADTGEEKAVVTTWLQFSQGILSSFSHTEPDVPAPVTLATPEVMKPFQSLVLDLASDNAKILGWLREYVTKVEVNDATATLEVCSEDFTFELDSKGKNVEGKPKTVPSYYRVTLALGQKGNQWQLTSYESEKTSNCVPGGVS